MRLVWCTDVHLNFLPKGGDHCFGEGVRTDFPDVDGVLLTGDIGECPNFIGHLDEFQKGVGVPVWYILGNHDAYGGGVDEMKAKAHAHDNPMVRYLEKERLVELAPSVALVGTDGWYDARNGEPKRSNVLMSDFYHIREMIHGGVKRSNIETARDIADASAKVALVLLSEAIEKGYKTIFFATHVPPYALSAWHEGKISDSHWLPWMSNRVMGTVIDDVAGQNPDVTFTVLCGHTHSAGKYQRHPNVIVLTGHAQYKFPRVCGDFKL